jgi:peptidoglycan/LPS O-acetylase OafA/YrhL
VDGFRALAILMVIGFHYFSRWTAPRSPENIYPYGGWLADVALFNYGYLGVELFFIVSGFVISLTLFVSSDWADFAWKRFSRLFPTMLLCSLVTYTFLNAVGSPWFNASYRDFLPSLTFTDPALWSKALGGSFRSIDAAYWSLQVEVKFYLWACLLFFVFGSQRFLLSFGTFFNVAFACGAITKFATLPQIFHIFKFRFLLLFCFLPGISALVCRRRWLLLSLSEAFGPTRSCAGGRSLRYADRLEVVGGQYSTAGRIINYGVFLRVVWTFCMAGAVAGGL